jgi:hypothetical protein
MPKFIMLHDCDTEFYVNISLITSLHLTIRQTYKTYVYVVGSINPLYADESAKEIISKINLILC